MLFSKTNEMRCYKTCRILVVDDDQMNILVYKAYLNSLELPLKEAEFAFNGLQAVEKFKKEAKACQNFDIVIMDCNMPVMDGFEATQTIRNFEKLENIAPSVIIAATANVSPIDFRYCFEAGMNDYISKPFSREQLKKILLKWMTSEI